MALVRTLLERARSRHWSFSDAGAMPDGAAVLHLEERVRALLVALVDADAEIIGTTSTLTIGAGATLDTLTLPTTMLKLVAVGATTPDVPDSREVPVELIPERAASMGAGHGKFRAFIRGGRVVPVRNGTDDSWSRVLTVAITTVNAPTVAALTDDIALPPVCDALLVAELAEFFAANSPKCPEPDKNRIERRRLQAAQELETYLGNVLAGVATNNVIRR